MTRDRNRVVFIPEQAWAFANADPAFRAPAGWDDAVRQRRGAGWTRMLTTTDAGLAYLIDVFDGYVLGVTDNYLRGAVTMTSWRLRRVAEGKVASS